MIGSKIFDLVKSYISDYLFGFDKSQLDTSILKGRINIKRVNIKPEKINELIDSLGIPIRLKAGIIGQLRIQIGTLGLDLWNIPMSIHIDTLLLIFSKIEI
jgi:hypothetical protein